MASASLFIYQKSVSFLGVFCFFVSACFLLLLGFFGARLFRCNGSSSKLCSNRSEISSEEENHKYSNPGEQKPRLNPAVEAKQDAVDFIDGFGQKESPEFCFKFKFPTYEEFSRSMRGKGDSITIEEESDTPNRLLMSVDGYSGSIQEPEVVSFNAKELKSEMGGGPFGDEDCVDDGFLLLDKDFLKINSEAKDNHKEIPENPTSVSCMEDVQEKFEAAVFVEEKGKLFERNKSMVDEDVSHEIQFHSEKDSFGMDSDSDSMGSSPLRRLMNRFIDSYSDGFLSDGDFGGESELENFTAVNGEKEDSRDEMSDLDDSSKENEEDDFPDEDTYAEEELRKIEEAHFRSAGKLNPGFLSEESFPGNQENSKLEENTDRKDKPARNSEKVGSKNSSDWDSEDSNKLETLWEHQELIEQLRMELKKVRATGLPTILEESETPKIAEDLKPWKIDERFQHADRMDELQKFYKSYRERMRKFDILNYQKMYAMGFLQQKDPLQSISGQKSSAPSLSLFRRKKIGSDPMMKFVKELQSDLEVVYVGQMCLSWEILHWQYGKALELWESDPRGVRQYNEVAGEFQQFQVLMQRFIEDETFQGPRVQNYVKSRCILRNLLQVPVVREDSTRDKKKTIKRRDKGDYAITCDLLVETMEESIRIFWRFVRADKDCSNAIIKCRMGSHVELQDPVDSDLLMEVRANLQKKERKLKDLLRSGNCILKRLRKCKEDGSDSSDHVLYFFSQVDMKLVWRVLNMSRVTTDQLHWCRQKLNKISFVNRKIRVEPSFLLFPC